MVIHALKTGLLFYTGKDTMFSSTPSEISTQTLFMAYVQQLAKVYNKKIVIYSPTQPQEEYLGYDAKAMVGYRELYLQFKRGEQNEDKNKQQNSEIRFKVPKKQLKVLKCKYTAGSAYFVVGGFWDVKEFLKLQQKLSDPSDS